MHPSIYREFVVSISPSPDGAVVDNSQAPVLYAFLKHIASGREVMFKLLGADAAPDRTIEEQVLRQFPESAAADHLRALYGVVEYQFRTGWDLAFADRLYSALERRNSKAARFWRELIPTLPGVLFSTMNARAVARLGELEPRVQLRFVLRTVHDAWYSVLREARAIPQGVRSVARLTLDLNGWPTQHLREMNLLEYGRFQEKALFAQRALAFLDDDDWTALLLPMLEQAPAPANVPPGSPHIAGHQPT